MTTRIALKSIARAEIYTNSGGKTMSEIKKSLNCSYIINGGLFNLLTFNPMGALTVQSRVMSYSDVYGMAFNGAAVSFSYANNMSAPYFIGAYPCLIRSGKRDWSSVPMGLEGKRPRSAIGLSGAEMVLYCTQDGKTLEEVTDELLGEGCANAINLDGGSSSQCDFGTQSLSSKRIVHNYICIWVKQDMEIPPEFPGTRYFSDGEKSRYVEWLGKMLIRAGYGSFYKVGASETWGAADKNACAAFQRAQGWTDADADGIPGKETWSRLVAAWNNAAPAAPQIPSVSTPAVPKNYAEKGVNTRSIDNLMPYVGYLCRKLMNLCAKEGINLIVTGTLRDATYQKWCKETGVSATAEIGPHAFGLAFDVAINDKADAYNVAKLKRAGEIGKAIGLEWGGDWKSFPDAPHFQYVSGLSDAELRAGKRAILPDVPAKE